MPHGTNSSHRALAATPRMCAEGVCERAPGEEGSRPLPDPPLAHASWLFRSRKRVAIVRIEGPVYLHELGIEARPAPGCKLHAGPDAYLFTLVPRF